MQKFRCRFWDIISDPIDLFVCCTLFVAVPHPCKTHLVTQMTPRRSLLSSEPLQNMQTKRSETRGVRCSTALVFVTNATNAPATRHLSMGGFIQVLLEMDAFLTLLCVSRSQSLPLQKLLHRFFTFFSFSLIFQILSFIFPFSPTHKSRCVFILHESQRVSIQTGSQVEDSGPLQGNVSCVKQVLSAAHDARCSLQTPVSSSRLC